MWKLFLLFTLVPALELYLLIQIGQVMGALSTVLLIAVTGAVGAALAKREGLSVLSRLQAELQTGLPPADRLVEGLLVLIGGVLLITPGVLTDLTGFLLILPVSRRWLAPRLRVWLSRRFLGSGFHFSVGGAAFRAGGAAADRPEDRPPPRFDHPVA